MTKTCPACRTEITESAEAVMPGIRLPMRMYVWVCPQCGCEVYDDKPERLDP